MRLLPLLLGLSAALFAACGSDDGTDPGPSPPLAITAMIPATNATAVETGATVTVTFNQAINPATLTAATFRVKAGGVALPATITYDAATRTARVAAPLLPASSYQVEVTTGVRTHTDSALAAAAVWSFGTRTWQSVILEFPDIVGFHTSLAMDAMGRRHLSYHHSSNGDLKYTTCASSCTTPPGVNDSWLFAEVDALGTVGSYTSLAVDASRRLHVSYFGNTNFDLKYATCPADCVAGANWQTVAVDLTGNVGSYTALAVEGTGRVHITYQDITNRDLKYATCSAACATAANWQAVTVDATGDVGLFTSLKADASGRVHVSYYDASNADLKYATCAAACATATNWQAVTVDAPGAVGTDASLAVDASGRLHVSYYDATNGDLKYATCAGACATATNWQAATADASGLVGQYTSLAVDGSARVHVSYFDDTNDDLKYATCAAACGTAANWRSVSVDATGSAGWFTSLIVDANGRLLVSYHDITNTALKYIE